MRPLRTSSQARRKRASLRCWLPTWRTRLCCAHLLHQALALVDRERERLLAVDVLAGPGGGDVDQRVPVVGRAVDDDVDVVALEQLAEIVELVRAR